MSRTLESERWGIGYTLTHGFAMTGTLLCVAKLTETTMSSDGNIVAGALAAVAVGGTISAFRAIGNSIVRAIEVNTRAVENAQQPVVPGLSP